ncbi:hypothetical protein EUX98_g1212 [Antrodiella citrinella]|uniref:Uncharacterized protein n=1 Tax=Antrodiella citrinella TaxID=2447956 RepID=A0A4S4N3S7_9APHY|nr:hypothetical protein EUX98_g1212 [Antrodiella citrinella]
MRNEILPTSTLEALAFEQKVTLAKEIATVLRTNIVQARKSELPDGEASWKLRITNHTELGSNDSIKNPPPMESSRSARKRQASS